jgi:thiamine kinase-like enzyme
MWVIDWEYGGMNDPYFDLGDFCVEHPLTADEEKFVLTAYCGGMDEHRYARMMLYKLVVDLWWSIWAMVQSKVSKTRVRVLPLRHGPHRALQQERRAPRLRELARAGLSGRRGATNGV